jgi:hypothetical protein
LRPTCDRLESRELLSGAGGLISHAVVSPLVSIAVAKRQHPHKFSGPITTRLNTQPDNSFSTVPSNGDVNPYGVAFVPNDFPGGGSLHHGDILVSNFNNSSNVQGTGTTIVDIRPSGSQSVFFQNPSAPGLSTTLAVLQRGFVIVGNTPAALDNNGNLVPTGDGSLLIMNRFGKTVATLSDPSLLDGPWGLTVNDLGSRDQVFVSNVYRATVTRIDLTVPKRGNGVMVKDMVQIASGYVHRSDPAAFVVGPTGLAYDRANGVLYVASTGDNAIFAIRNAAHARTDGGMGSLVYEDPSHLRGPLGLALGPNGDLLTTNGDAVNPDPTQPSELIEFTRSGTFVAQLSLSSGQGGAFGLAMSVTKNTLGIATVNDVTNRLDERFVSF